MFLVKTITSLPVPLAFALLATASPVTGLDSVESTDPAVDAAPEALVSPQNEVEVTADRIRQPLAEPDTSSTLPRINLRDMQPWNWDGVWHASEWANGNSTIPWKYNRVRQGFSGNTHFVLDEKGAPELKAQKGHPAFRNAMYEVDVSIPAMRAGLLASPLLLWDDKSQDSIAIEVVGKRQLQITMHGHASGQRKTEQFSLPGDYSGRRMRLAIRKHTDLGLVDVFVDGELAHSFNDESPAFPTSNMLPIISMYAGDKHAWSRNWAGEWQALERGEKITMTVHGYRVTPL